MKRDLLTHKRDEHLIRGSHLKHLLGRDLHTLKTSKCTQKRPIDTQKRPIDTQKRPIDTQKRPIDTQKR